MRPLPDLIGESPGIAAVRETIGRLLQRQSDARRLPPILIQGETGTGKGLVARAIHRAGPRADGPFVDVNCAAIPETLLEAEMFGFERGAFTDARQPKRGLFQAAQRGTIFLDEAALLPEALQSKLLKAIEERAVRRLGSTHSEPVDVWILTATSEDLLTATRQRRFREDLYHRLAVLTIWLPPLRERGGDILLLAEQFLGRACADYDLPQKSLTQDARAALVAYPWPGNVRELANVIERVALLSEEHEVTAESLGLTVAPRRETAARPGTDAVVPLGDAVGSVERAHLLEALRQTRWNISRAAARLGIPRNTLRYRIEKHGLRPEAGPSRLRRRADGVPAAFPMSAPVPVPAVTAIRWERRRLTLLRVVLVPPSGEQATLDPTRAQAVLVEKAQSFGGRVIELAASGIVAAFGFEPVEDAPRRAAHAAMAIQKAAERDWEGQAAGLQVKSVIYAGQFMVGWLAATVEIDQDAKRPVWALLDALVADLARAHRELGHEAWALRLLGELASRSDPPLGKQAEDFYQQGLALADELGMLPLSARCHLSLGLIHRRRGDPQSARAHLTVATALFRETDMRPWLERAEAEPPARHSGIADDQDVNRLLFSRTDDCQCGIVADNDPAVPPIPSDRARVPHEIVGHCRGLDPLGRSSLRVGGMLGDDHLDHV